MPPGAGSASDPREVQVGDRVRGAPQCLPIQRPSPIPKINPTFSVSPHPAPREATPRMPSLPSLTCAGEGANHRAQCAAPAVTASSQLVESLAPVAVCARRATSPGVLLTAAPAPAAARTGDLTTFLNRRLQLAPFLGSRTVPCAPPSTPSPPGSGARDRPGRRRRQRGRRGGEIAPGLLLAAPGTGRRWGRSYPGLELPVRVDPLLWRGNSASADSRSPGDFCREPGTPRGAQPSPTSLLTVTPGRRSALLFLSKLRVTLADARRARAFEIKNPIQLIRNHLPDTLRGKRAACTTV